VRAILPRTARTGRLAHWLGPPRDMDGPRPVPLPDPGVRPRCTGSGSRGSRRAASARPTPCTLAKRPFDPRKRPSRRPRRRRLAAARARLVSGLAHRRDSATRAAGRPAAQWVGTPGASRCCTGRKAACPSRPAGCMLRIACPSPIRPRLRRLHRRLRRSRSRSRSRSRRGRPWTFVQRLCRGNGALPGAASLRPAARRRQPPGHVPAVGGATAEVRATQPRAAAAGGSRVPGPLADAGSWRGREAARSSRRPPLAARTAASARHDCAARCRAAAAPRPTAAALADRRKNRPARAAAREALRNGRGGSRGRGAHRAARRS
jgi:hypothetical protein